MTLFTVSDYFNTDWSLALGNLNVYLQNYDKVAIESAKLALANSRDISLANIDGSLNKVHWSGVVSKYHCQSRDDNISADFNGDGVDDFLCRGASFVLEFYVIYFCFTTSSAARFF